MSFVSLVKDWIISNSNVTSNLLVEIPTVSLYFAWVKGFFFFFERYSLGQAYCLCV